MTLGERTDAILVTGSAWLARLGGALVLASAVLVGAEVVLRNLFGLAVLHSFELTIYLFAVAVSLSFGHALVRRAHIRIDVVTALLPRPVRAVLDLLALVAITALAVLYAVHGWGVVAQSAALGARSNTTLAVPLAVPEGAWAVGLTLFALTAAVLTLRVAGLLARGRVDAVIARAGVADEAAEEGGGAGDGPR